MKTALKNFGKRLPLLRQLIRYQRILAERDRLGQELQSLQARFDRQAAQTGIVPAGHFYSPLLSLEDRARYRNTKPLPPSYPGIDLNYAGQVALLDQLKLFYQELPFTADKQVRLRYYFENDAYSYSDAICLYSMIRHVRPARIIEIGSGFSSCVTLDTNERFFNNRIACTFIEPNPHILQSLIREEDRQRIEVMGSPLQEVDPAYFSRLQSGDILFIDSTHVYKPGSDVELIFSRILPAVPSGVYVHFHDMFYPFEYPQHWIAEGRAWNELYLVAAFLQFNAAFRIELWNHYMYHFHRDFLAAHMPLCLKNPGGSMWLRRL